MTWIDESGMLIHSPAMQAIISMTPQSFGGKKTFISTPKQVGFIAQEIKLDRAFEERLEIANVIHKPIGKLLYG